MRTRRPIAKGLAGTVFLFFMLSSLSLVSLPAQGSFYAEVPKDGRIYVFNRMAVYEAWKNSGEMGESITRIGAGPNGETLVFDSEEAIHLYNFKHDLPGEVMVKPEEKKSGIKIGWKDGKTTLETDKARLSISNRVQLRFTNDQEDGEEARGSYRIRRAKTKLAGWIYTPDLEYELQVNWADTSNSLEDAMVNYDTTRGRQAFQIRGGQFKVPFGRQELTSSGSQQFVDRSIVSNEFAKGRDIGLQLWGRTPHGRVEWSSGMFNGNGRNKSSNDNSRYQYDARVLWQPFGDAKYSESDFESSDKPLLALAAGYETNNMDDQDPNTSQISRKVLGTDVVFKLKGLSVFGEYFKRRNEPEATADYYSTGFHAQIGCFVFERHVELALRYATFDPSDEVAGDDQTEKGLAVNWFLNKHNLKLQADYRRIEDDAADTTDAQARLQFQFAF